ncbi:MAG: ABC transporter permease [Rectinemataceae bacterium]|nr:ABC transporter permease [Rectinemataceae bacterium]
MARKTMRSYIGKRLLLMIPVLMGVSFIIFAIMSLTPGDPATMILGEGAPKEALEAKRNELGLDKAFIVRYFDYLKNAVKGDFGVSYRTGIKVFDEIKTRLPYTLQLASISLILAVIIGIPIGVISAVKQYSIVDTAAIGISLLITSMPSFLLGMILIIVFSLKLGWLPMIGLSSLKHYILPAIATSSAIVVSLLRMTRTTMLEVIRQEYIKTARAKGAGELKVIYGHALRNALLPVVTLIGVDFGNALAGSIVVEQVFSIPGLGQLMVNSIRTKDTPMVMASVLAAAVFASFVILLLDLVYAYIDPRLKFQYKSAGKRTKQA